MKPRFTIIWTLYEIGGYLSLLTSRPEQMLRHIRRSPLLLAVLP
jgi:hypothetical protein